MELPLEIPQDILDARRFDRIYLSGQTLERGIPEISNGLKKTRGLIIDLRYYPSQDFVDFIFKYILPNSTIKVAQYTYPLLTLPGVFVVGNQTYRVSDNDKYNAPIVVLVNEGNQSAAETSVQVIQCNPNTQPSVLKAPEPTAISANLRYLGEYSAHFPG